MLTCVFEKFIKVSFNEFDIILLYCVSLPVFVSQCRLKNTGISLQTNQDKEVILLLQIYIRGGMSSVKGDRYVKSVETEKILYIDDNILFGWPMSESLPYDEINFVKTVKSEDVGWMIQILLISLKLIWDILLKKRRKREISRLLLKTAKWFW